MAHVAKPRHRRVAPGQVSRRFIPLTAVTRAPDYHHLTASGDGRRRLEKLRNTVLRYESGHHQHVPSVSQTRWDRKHTGYVAAVRDEVPLHSKRLLPICF